MGRLGSWWATTTEDADRRQAVAGLADHQRQHAAWEADRQDLVRALASVEANESWTAETIGRPLSFKPKRGERIYVVVDGAGLVEHRRKAGHWAGGYSGFSVQVTKGLRWNVGGSRGTYVPGPEEPTLIDSGTVTVTDRRVVFQGGSQSREWSYTKLLGYTHQSSAPITLIHVSNRQKVSGILYDAAAGPLFQLRLATAIAYSNGTEAALIAGLRGELAQHDATRPIPPPPGSEAGIAATATLSGAALATYRGWPRWARIAAPAFAVVMVLGGIGSAFEEEPREVELSSSEGTTSTTEHIETTTTERETTTTEEPTTTTAAPTTTTAAPTTTTAPPPPPTTVYVPPPPPTTVAPAPVNKCDPNYSGCVPIASDVDCAGGSGNGPAYADGPVTVVGSDIYDLDSDSDGIGCE